MSFMASPSFEELGRPYGLNVVLRSCLYAHARACLKVGYITENTQAKSCVKGNRDRVDDAFLCPLWLHSQSARKDHNRAVAYAI
jgi:hypothetical protein